MANKRKNNRGAKKSTVRKYFQGGSAYALPTSMNATTGNQMGLGDPNMLNAALARSNEALDAQMQQARLDQEQQMEQRTMQSQQQFQAAMNQNQAKAGQGVLQGLQTGMDVARIGKGTANAAEIARQSADVGQLLGNLGSYGTQAQSAGRLANAGQAIGQGLKAAGPAAIGAGLGVGGAFIEHKSDDLDPTTMNFGETTGKLMKGAGMGLGLSSLAPLAAIPGIGWIGAGVGALGYGIHGLVQRNKARVEQDKIDRENEIARINTSRGYTDAFNNSFTRTGADMGFNVGNSMTNSYTPSQQIMYKDGGKKVPGGVVKPLPGGAVEFVGASHDNGGILIDSQTEVEGGETMDKVKMSEGGESEYIFSDHLKLGGKSFGQRHKEILKRGGGQREIQNLAKLQELVASKKAENPEGRTPEKIMRNGGVMQYQDGDTKNKFDEYNPFGFGRGESWAYTAQTPGAIDYEGVVGGKDFGSIANTGWGQYYNRGQMLDPEAYNAIQSGGMEQLYDDVYMQRANQFYDNNPDQAYKWLQDMYNSDTPDAEMFRRKLSDSEGNMLPKEEALRIARELSTDKKVGPFHLYLGNEMQEMKSKGAQPIEQKVDKELQGTSVTVPSQEPEPEKSKKVPPAWMGALPGLLGLQRNPPAPTARTISAETTRMANLPRINLNAERAANSAMNVGTRRQLANQVGGPAGMAASLAANQQSRQQNLDIAQRESMANKDLMAQEASLNANIAQQNAGRAQQTASFNASNLSRSDLERYQQDILDKQRNKDVVTGVARDAMQYAAQERYANALDAFNAYQRMQTGEKSSDGTAADKASKAQEKTVETAAKAAAAPKTVNVAGQTLGAPSLLSATLTPPIVSPVTTVPGGGAAGVPSLPTSPVATPTAATPYASGPAGSSAIIPGLRYGGYIPRSNKIRPKRRK